jgi:hypothetical protein
MDVGVKKKVCFHLSAKQRQNDNHAQWGMRVFQECKGKASFSYALHAMASMLSRIATITILNQVTLILTKNTEISATELF